MIHDIQSLNESLTTIMEEISEKKRNNRDISSDTVRLNLELNQKRIDLNNINKKEKQYQLIKIIIDCICRLLQNKTLFPQIKKRIRNENNINELLNLFLQDKLIIYNIRTHTEKYTGSSQTGDEAGIVDFYFTDSNDNMLFLMEALYVDDPFNAEYVKSHYKKLINAYDQIGRPFHILLMYSLCSEFNESYQKYSNLYKEQQFKPPITSDGCIPIVKEFEQTSEIKVGLSNYERSGNICSIYHIYCNFSQTSLNF